MVAALCGVSGRFFGDFFGISMYFHKKSPWKAMWNQHELHLRGNRMGYHGLTNVFVPLRSMFLKGHFQRISSEFKVWPSPDWWLRLGRRPFNAAARWPRWTSLSLSCVLRIWLLQDALPCRVWQQGNLALFSLSETHDDSGIYIGTIFMTFYDCMILYVLFVVERALKQFQGRAQRFPPMPLKVAPLMSTCPQWTCPQWHWWGSTKEPKKSAGGHDYDFFKAQSSPFHHHRSFQRRSFRGIFKIPCLSPAFGASSSHDEISVCVGASETGV